jgi:hypothetical protein
MSRSKLARTIGVTAAAVLAAGAMGVVPAGATKVVRSSLEVSPEGDRGIVESPDASCIAGRTVTLKQKGFGFPLSRGISYAEGNWELDLEKAGENLQGRRPYLVYAVLRPRWQGPRAACLGYVSRTFRIDGNTIRITVG